MKSVKKDTIYKYVIRIIPAIILVCLALVPLSSQNSDGKDTDTSLATLITENFASSYKIQNAQKGNDFQFIANTYYGAQLGWPLVWFFNSDTIPDPESIKVGTPVKIPRLKSGLDEDTAFQVLQVAYILVYGRYRSIEARTAGQRRWVLTQAAEAGCNLADPNWDNVLDAADRDWLQARGIKTTTRKTVPQAVTVEPILTADLIAAAVANNTTAMDALAEKFEKADKIDDIIADLESKAADQLSPPEIHLALSVLYGRKGLRTQEYVALLAAETAAAKPGVTFNLAIVHGRKKLLSSAPDADSFMVGCLELRSTPDGASVFVDNVLMGNTPLRIEKVKAGTRQIRLENKGYNPWSSQTTLGVGRTVIESGVLEAKPGSISIETIPAGVTVCLDRNTDNRSYETTPFVFENVQAGPHIVTIEGQLVDEKKYYLGTGDIDVTVPPGDNITIQKSLTPENWRLRLTEFPEGCEATLDGATVNANDVFGDGIVTDAGRRTIEVTTPIGQRWGSMLSFRNDTTLNTKSNQIYSMLLRRTIKIDGEKDDWKDLYPIWTVSTTTDPFPNQSGTKITDVYVCRDDKNFNWRIDFSDGSPTTKLSDDFKQRLLYNIQIFISESDLFALDITINRGSSTTTSLSQYNTQTQKGTGSATNCITYKFGEGFLEASIPLKYFGKKLPEKALKTMFKIANTDAKGNWLKESVVGGMWIDYYK